MKNLLHVDDDPAWLEVFAELAGDLDGLKLRQCSSLNEALKAIREDKPDIVITDLHLAPRPDQSGYVIARAAREANVSHVTIASATGTPSQQIEGVTIQEKDSALGWLRRLAGGGSER